MFRGSMALSGNEFVYIHESPCSTFYVIIHDVMSLLGRGASGPFKLTFFSLFSVSRRFY